MRHRHSLLCSATGLILAASASPAMSVEPAAQDASSPALPQPEAESATNDIVVTASRIDRAGFTAPTPTTVVGADILENRAAVNVADVLNEVPSFRRTNAPESGGIGNSGANNVDLRGLTPLRTLVLLDRMRLPAINLPLSQTGAVPDLNMIPTALIRSVDVVTGGASAAYGSDAVAGVVNLQLETKLQGLKGNMQYGQTKYKDANEFFGSLAAGTSFADGRGHVVIGGEFNLNDGTDLLNTRRPWGRRNATLITLPTNRAADLPANLIADNVTFGTLTPGGLIAPIASNPAGLRNLQFVRNGNGTVTTAPFDAGLYQGQSGTQMVGGTGTIPYQVLRGQSDRFNILGNVTYELSDTVDVWLQGLYAEIKTDNIVNQRRDATGGVGTFLTFRRDNAYLQQALTPGQLAQVPAAGLSIGYLGNDFGPAELHVDNKVGRVAGGLKGEFGEGWKWDASGQYSKAKSTVVLDNVSLNGNFANAIDAVTVTAANVGTSGLAIGSIACRSTLTSPTNGCAPINILGKAAYSPAAYNYVFGTSALLETTSTLKEFSANINGEPFSLWAGPVSVGVGAEYRRESLETTADPISESGARTGFNSRSAKGFPQVSQTVKEAYAEVIVPLLKDLPFAQSLDLNAAARYTDYSTSGTAKTWKAGLTWKPVSDLMLRGTLSRDIRAPNLTELFTAQSFQTPANLATNDRRPAFVNVPPYSYDVLLGGNPNLRPEVARTMTLGAVLTPSFVPRLQFSVDFYRIRISDAIGTFVAATTVENCVGAGAANPGNPFCSLVTFANNDPVNGAITSVNAGNGNAAEFKTKGLDFALSYVQPLGDIAGADGRLALNVQATHVMEYRSSLDVSASYPNGVDRAGQTGAGTSSVAGLPSWLVNANANLKVGKVGVNVQLRYISKSRQNNALIGPDQAGYSPTLFNSINNNVVPAVAYVNVGGSYNFGTDESRKELYFTVNNLFNKEPPLPAFNNNAYYDLLGQTWRVGFRFNF